MRARFALALAKRHVGGIDVDLALNHRDLREAGYATIQALLARRGYEQEPRQRFIYHRTVVVNGEAIKVEVDFLAGEYESTGAKHRTQPVHEGRAWKARGCDLAFDLTSKPISRANCRKVGGTRRIRVSFVVAFLAMKSRALHDRLKEKDARDIYFTLINYPGGLDALAEEIRRHLNQGLVQVGLRKIAEKFGSPDHVGPKVVADRKNARFGCEMPTSVSGICCALSN